jgi:F0F1-type ATP synthase assembly protein I
MADGDIERTMARLMSLAAVGSEIVAPIAIGVGIDFWLGTLPWCTVIGAILGPILGVYHLILLNRPKPP